MGDTLYLSPDNSPGAPGAPTSGDQNEWTAIPGSLFKCIVELTPAAHFITDGKKFLYVNPAFEILTGYSKSELFSLAPEEVLSHIFSEFGAFACNSPRPDTTGSSQVIISFLHIIGNGELTRNHTITCEAGSHHEMSRESS